MGGVVFPPCCLTWGQTLVKVMKIMQTSFKRFRATKKKSVLLMVPLSPTCHFFFLNKIKGMSIQVCCLLVSILGWVLLPFHQMVTIEIIFSYDRVDWQKCIIYICIYMYTHIHTYRKKWKQLELEYAQTPANQLFISCVCYYFFAFGSLCFIFIWPLATARISVS